MWDISRCLPVHSLEGHTEAVFAVDLDDKLSLVFTGSADRVPTPIMSYYLVFLEFNTANKHVEIS